MSARPPSTPILWLSGGLLGGQIAAPWTTGWAFAAAALTAALVVVARAPRSHSGRMVALAALAAAVGHQQLDARLNPALPPHHIARFDSDRVVLRGTIEQRPSRRAAGLRFVFEVDGERRGKEWVAHSGQVLLTVGNSRRDWRRGDRLTARIRLRTPRNFGNPGEFDYEHYLARRGIYATGYSHSDEDWQRLERTDAASWADSVRWHASSTLEQVAPPHLRPVAAALLLGDGASIPQEIRRRYARAGVSHVLAISGLHVGLVVAGAYAGLRWLLARSEHLLLAYHVPKLATAASLPPLLAYTAIAGASAATLRAAVMAALLLSALLIDRPRHWPSTLAAAAAAVCLTSPGAVFEASFQLSFAAVIAIVSGGRRLRDAYDARAERRLLRLAAPRRHAVARWLALSQAVTMLAIAVTAPLTLYHFQQLSLVGLISNLVVVPITGMGAVGVGLAAVLVNPLLPGLGGILFGACCMLLQIGDTITTGFAALPGADLHLPVPSIAEIAAYYALLATALIHSARGRVAAIAATLTVIAIQLGSWHVERVTSDELRLTFLSVGQGDSILVELPGGDVMLVDGGGLSSTFDVGERVVAPLLLRRKILAVDTIVLTHPDFDHYGGLGYIAQRFGVGELWSNGSRGSGQRYRDFQDRIAGAGVSEVTVRRGLRRTIGGVDLRVVHPVESGADDSNDASVTLHLSFGGVAILLTGDLEKSGELALLRHGGDLRSAILKVPHHGSATSSTTQLLNAVQPHLAVVSAGHLNRYRMPHPEVVERYRGRKTRLLRTDLDGAIEIRIAPSGTVRITSGRRWRIDQDIKADPALGATAYRLPCDQSGASILRSRAFA